MTGLASTGKNDGALGDTVYAAGVVHNPTNHAWTDRTTWIAFMRTWRKVCSSSDAAQCLVRIVSFCDISKKVFGKQRIQRGCGCKQAVWTQAKRNKIR